MLKKMLNNGSSREMANRSRTSLRFRVTLAMIFIALIPGILLSLIYFGNTNNFYKDKIEISVIRLIQIDISYQKIKDAMDYMEVTDKDMVLEKLYMLPTNSRRGKLSNKYQLPI